MAEVHQDFKNKKMVPIVFSHGLTASRCFYSLQAKELASQGYVVFLMDHHDGSCIYTETPKRVPVKFDASVPFYNYSDMHKKVKIRESEISKLINFLQDKKFEWS